jgi:prolyl oligopeptidase PreP (S9A serine peptidase family)
MTETSAIETIGTPKVPVSSTYHGVTVTEDYRWLEDAGSEQTRAWTAAQDRRTRAYLQGLPWVEAVRRRARELLTAGSAESGGHGLGSSLDQKVSELADIHAFLFDQLGVDYR